MFSTNRWINWVISLAFVATMGCSGGLGGCGCGEEPLPSWDYIPVDQQVEGGGQIRVTPNGFDKLTQLVPAVLNDTLADGMCIGELDPDLDIGIATVDGDACHKQGGVYGCNAANGGGVGCQVDFNVDYINMSVTGSQTLNVAVQVDVGREGAGGAFGPVVVPINYDAALFELECDLTAQADNVSLDTDIRPGINETNGELTLNVDGINSVDLSGLTIGVRGGFVCDFAGFFADIVNVLFDLLSTPIGNFLIDLLAPVIDDLVQGILPDPLGLNHKIDAGALVSGISPGTNATLEFRGVPGGYVEMTGGGMSLGLITGFNSDEDESTRTPDLDSEPALCVPPLPPVDFAAAPHNLPVQPARGTFALPVAGEFNGSPDPAAELAIGLSETTLDLTGHHAVTSGLMCMGIGTALVDQLNLGTIGILVPSLAELGSEDGSDPLLMVLRPQKALDFTVGEGTEADPSLQIAIDGLEIDFYAFLFERYVRGFTIAVTMDVGINLEFTTDANGDPAILPVLTGLETDQIGLTVHNGEFLREDNATLEQVLPAIFDLALPLITNGLEPFALPDFAGFSLTNLSVNKVTTAEDDFLALFATLGSVSSSPRMQDLFEKYPSLADKMNELAPPEEPAVMAKTRAELEEVYAPRADVSRAWFAAHPDGELPQVTLDVPTHDNLGRPLEYSWSMKRGIMRAFRQPTEDGKLVIRDRGFAIQGRHSITVTSRVVGDYRTHDREGVEVDFVIDSVGPRVFVDQMKAEDGALLIPAADLVTPRESLLYAYGRVTDERPATDWKGGISLEEAGAIAGEGGMLRVWVADELGNETTVTVDVGPLVGFHGSAGEGGCDCAAGGMDSASAGGLAFIAGMTMLLLGFRRRSRVLARVARWVPYVGGVIAISALPACSCGGDPGGDLVCEIDEDCLEFCPENTIPVCFDNQCVCAEDVPYGRMGQHSDLAVTSDGAAWVSGYNSSHGDLVVSRWTETGPIPNQEWEFVDGVPDGPVVLPESDIRGGIFEAGPNTGIHTSIAAQPDGSVVVSYFDIDTGSLKFASNAGGSWAIHTVEQGQIEGDPELGFTQVGKYTSITVRSDDGRPGIAYLAEVGDGGGNITTEVRYAAASSPNPSSTADWNVWVVDTDTQPAPTSEEPDLLGIPNGVGLFIDSARTQEETPVLVYYDRPNGDLKMAEFDAVAGTFAAPVVLDSGDRDMVNTDVGWYPSVSVDMNDDVHVTYVSSTNDDLYYMNTVDMLPEIVDDGYRIVGQTNDGLPKPEFHFVGDDSSVELTSAGPIITYQDATTHELLVGQRNVDGDWEHETLAGDEDPFTGGYGFYADSEVFGDELVMSTWVVDQPANAVWVEIFRRMIVVQ